jgi:probable HAF family extracellular repeat protein
MQFLPPLPGASTLFNTAFAASADGSVIVGQAKAADGLDHAVRWTSAGAQDLGLGFAYAVSDDGLVVAGPGLIWTAATGRLAINDYLTMNGVSIPPSWDPAFIFALSGDGRTIAGDARSTSGLIQGFVATIPARASPVLVVSTAMFALRRRRGTP